MYSEDPRLSSALTSGYVSGIQGVGDGTEPTGGDGVKLAAACCKHLAAYGLSPHHHGLSPHCQPMFAAGSGQLDTISDCQMWRQTG